MPMVIITGLPASGKSTIAKRISEYIIEKKGSDSVTILADDDEGDGMIRQFYGNSVKVSRLFYFIVNHALFRRNNGELNKEEL